MIFSKSEKMFSRKCFNSLAGPSQPQSCLNSLQSLHDYIIATSNGRLVAILTEGNQERVGIVPWINALKIENMMNMKCLILFPAKSAGPPVSLKNLQPLPLPTRILQLLGVGIVIQSKPLPLASMLL